MRRRVVDVLVGGVRNPQQQAAEQALQQLHVANRREFAQQLFLTRIETNRSAYVKVDVQITTAMPAQMRDALAANCEDLTGLSACSHLEWLGAVECLQIDARTQSSSRHRHDESAMQIITTSFEDRVVLHHKFDVDVGCRATTRTNLALTGELNTRAGVDASRDLYGQ